MFSPVILIFIIIWMAFDWKGLIIYFFCTEGKFKTTIAHWKIYAKRPKKYLNLYRANRFPRKVWESKEKTCSYTVCFIIMNKFNLFWIKLKLYIKLEIVQALANFLLNLDSQRLKSYHISTIVNTVWLFLIKYHFLIDSWSNLLQIDSLAWPDLPEASR